jgi:hypothetical protein
VLTSPGDEARGEALGRNEGGGDIEELGVRQPAAAAGTLKTGEYACYGSGGRIMIGLGFKVTGPGRYTDLDGGNAGRFTVSGGKVRFTGGHMDGQVGTMVGGNDFRIGMQARCEPY